MNNIRQCPAGHLSLGAANWECPWCEVERLRSEFRRIEGEVAAEWRKHDSAPDCVACAALDAALAGGEE